MQPGADIETDYLIVGAGAVGMAIADTLINESDFNVAIIDRRHKPGGHWNDAYPFVRLHGPSANYGVNSLHLGSDRIETSGLNEGLFELATGAEICAYFDKVMRQTLLPSKRVRYLPMHDYDGQDVVSILSGIRTKVRARRKIIDATIAGTGIPSRSNPPFRVADGVAVMPPNDLVKLDRKASQIVVVGAGKTSIDTVVWLLENGCAPDTIVWIRPRDAWLLNRETVQPDYSFFEKTFGWLTTGWEAAAQANSADDIFLHLERSGYMRRIDETIMPTMYRCAIVSDRELSEARRINNVVRMGRVQQIEPGLVTLDSGTLSYADGAIFVNCAADGIPYKPPQTVFQPGKIVPQYLRNCSPTFSGALIAKIELVFKSDAEKNTLCRPTPIPDKPEHWITMELAMAANSAAWRAEPALKEWLVKSRLDQINRMISRAITENDVAKLQLLERYTAAIQNGSKRLIELVQTA